MIGSAHNFKDMTGLRFGKLTVLSIAGKQGRCATWLCRCDCGRTKVVNGSNLRMKYTSSCGCVPKHEDLTGHKFGRLTVLSVCGEYRETKVWLCKCECGKLIRLRSCNLLSGGRESCGCGNHDIDAAKYKAARGIRNVHTEDTLWNVWSALKTRCYNPSSASYKNYGGRGILVCEAIRNSVGAIIRTIGPKPTNKSSIDRINVNGNYSCGGCQECNSRGWPLNIRWLDMKSQQRNRRNNHKITIGGITACASEWEDRCGIKAKTIIARMNSGWPEGRLLEPVRNYETIH